MPGQAARTRVGPSSMRFSMRSLAGLAVLVLLAPSADATIITVANPSVPTEIGTRIRWGGSGFEASIFDAAPLNQGPALNPAGGPAWAVGTPYSFQIGFSALSGALTLAIDFNRDGDYADAQESASRSVFTSPGLTSYLGQGFTHLSISGNESGSSARSTLTNLVINGSPQASLTPAGTSIERFYANAGANPLAQLIVIGQITFLTAGTASERPSWNVNLKGPVAVPEPGPALLLAVGLLGIALVRSRRPGRGDRAVEQPR